MKNDCSSNRKRQPFIDKLDEEKASTISDLKELARRAFSRIQRDKTWTGHLFSTDKGRIHGILLYKKHLSTIIDTSLSSGDSDNYYEKIDLVTQPPANP